MLNSMEIADKIFSILSKEEKIKCSFLRKDNNYCYVKVENYNNDNQECIIIDNHIFFQIDDEEYFELNDYEVATDKFIEKLKNIVDIRITYMDDKEPIEYGFYTRRKEKIKLIEETQLKIKNEFAFMKNILKMTVTSFFENCEFEEIWNGETFTNK